MDQEQKKSDVSFPHDSSYRYLLSSKKLFIELLRSFVRRGWVGQVDETNVEEINRSFVLPDFKRKEADLVYKVRLNDRDVIFYVLVELQSTVDPAMPYRLLLYQVEIWRFWLRNRHSDGGEMPFSLPAIVPIVLYNGQRPWTAKRRFRELLVGEEAFGSELIDFEYILLDVERYTEEELLSLSNTIGAVFLLDQTANQELLLERLRKLTNTIRRMPEDMQTQFMNWLVNMIASQLPAESRDVQQMIRELKESGVSIMGLQKNLEAIRQRGFEEGIEKGFEKGYEQGILQVAKRLIDMGLDNSAIAAATGLSQDKIERLRNPFRS